MPSRIGGRLPCVGLRRAVAMSFVALCKFALLLAPLEASVGALESNVEVSECVKIDLANPPQGLGFARRVLVKRLAARCLRVGLGTAAGRCSGPVAYTAATDGHRLANRLCAPMQC